MIFKKLMALNAKQMQLAFFAGSTVGCIMGSAAGVGIGVALGLMFAPKSGKDLRKDLKGKGCELADTMKERGGELAENMKERGLKLKEDAQTLYEELGEKLAEKRAS
ncbi:MAG TPA: YtxH domain-containing protein [Planktothrix sp.]|jgi:gas vesicle protein